MYFTRFDFISLKPHFIITPYIDTETWTRSRQRNRLFLAIRGGGGGSLIWSHRLVKN